MASRGVAALLTTVVVVVLLLLLQHQPVVAAGADAGATEDLRYRGRHRGFRHRNTPTAPVQPVHPPPPPPPPRQFCNDTFGAEVSLTASGDICVPVPAPAPPVPPPRGLRCPPCTCPRPPQPRRPFIGWTVPLPVPVPGRGSSNGDSGADIDCITALAPLMTCGEFVTAANETETPAPDSQCCSGLAAFLRTSSAAAAAGGGDRMLRCLCPVILGDVNKVLPRPIDPVRMMYLPIACGVVLPPQVLYVCFTGRPSPPVVTNFPQNSESGQSP